MAKNAPLSNHPIDQPLQARPGVVQVEADCHANEQGGKGFAPEAPAPGHLFAGTKAGRDKGNLGPHPNGPAERAERSPFKNVRRP